MFELSKKFRFETAHRLAKGYEGKCNNIHGHSWNGELFVHCKDLDDKDMGVDYAELKPIIKMVEEKYDHKLVLYAFDPLAETLKNADFHNGIVHLEANPTSETVAKDIWEIAESYIKLHELPCTLYKVEIEETCTSRCVYKKSIERKK